MEVEQWFMMFFVRSVAKKGSRSWIADKDARNLYFAAEIGNNFILMKISNNE